MTMNVPKNYRQILESYEKTPKKIQDYFFLLPKLILEFPYFTYDLSIAYMFAQVETAHNMTLYCGVVRNYRVDPKMAYKAVNMRIGRNNFRDLFKEIFGKSLPKNLISQIQEAEKTRDAILHGRRLIGERDIAEKDKRVAVIYILQYAKGFNKYVKGVGGFEPFGSLQGVMPTSPKKLEKPTSRLILQGLGFNNIK